MSNKPSTKDLEEVDEFFAEQKTLQGAPPFWAAGTRDGEYQATWPIEEVSGVSRAHLRFKCPKMHLSAPSISVIFRNQPVYRLDLTDPAICKPNSLLGIKVGLPAEVCGNHAHTWSDNRKHIEINGFGELPLRRPAPEKARRLPQALPWLAGEINLVITPDQRRFDVPTQRQLF